MTPVTQKQLDVWQSYKGKDDFITWGFEFYKQMVKLEEIAASLEEIRKHFSIEALKMEVKSEETNISLDTPLVTVQDFYKLKAQEAAKLCRQIADDSCINQFWDRITEAAVATAEEVHQKQQQQ